MDYSSVTQTLHTLYAFCTHSILIRYIPYAYDNLTSIRYTYKTHLICIRYEYRNTKSNTSTYWLRKFSSMHVTRMISIDQFADGTAPSARVLAKANQLQRRRSAYKVIPARTSNSHLFSQTFQSHCCI
jgi:hypothetical protein